ncbi:unnamed protein product [Rotaria sp. Silwood1]|nr:unnamed protein product [Rotaria sp. Silwood1]CAF1561600.1 unnamed protein product [Rotaria sp. Silwood1]
MSDIHSPQSNSSSTSNLTTTPRRILKAKRSLVWRYFKIENDSFDVECILCSSTVPRTSTSTSNMLHHLQIRHKLEYELINKATKSKNDASSQRLPLTSARSEHLTKLAANLLIHDLLPLSVVESCHLQTIFREAEPSYVLPRRKYFVTNVLKDMYNSTRNKVQHALHNAIDNQLFILLFGTTLTSLAIILVYFQQQKKKKSDEEQKNEYLKCKSLFDFEELAKKLLMPHRFYYFNYKAGQGHTYQACRDYFDKRLRIMTRILIDVRQISLKTNIFGEEYSCPIIIAPSAYHCLAHIDGEVGTARGATEAQCIYTYNWMYSNILEDNVLQTTGPKFLHVYLTMPIEILEKLVEKAAENGYRAIVVTCDDPTSRVWNNILPVFLEASKNIDPNLMKTAIMPNMNIFDLSIEPDFYDGSITWTNIERLRKLTTLPIICKGILSPMDAELAIKYGANGILVSNHGGRQIDTTVPAIECLEDIVNIVNGRVEVFVDTGIRNGSDILKALALGARAVFIGRPILYGLTCGGHDGVRRVLDILKQELIYDMACCGLARIDQINKDILYKPS